jgi:hypothetical protein
MIHAIASGKQAARSVYRYLRGKEIAPEEGQFHYPMLRQTDAGSVTAARSSM